ncbi:MAG: SMC-Scp complex subunit ScpB [Gemmataceae bacterium]
MRVRYTQYGPSARRLSSARPGNAVCLSANRGGRVVEVGPTDPLGRDAATARVEAALLFAEEPLPARRVAEAAGLTDGHEARRVLDRLRKLYEADDSAFRLSEVAGGFQLLTRAELHPWLLRVRRTGGDPRLTPVALEVLTVIAYKQPITRAEVDAVRGVGCAEIIRLLMEKGLVRTGGRHDSLGRPHLYVTTKKFLQLFGLNSADELPKVGERKPSG